MFSNEEYRDMHYLYGLCDGNAAAAEREYQIRFPRRQHPKRRVFEALHRRMGETGVFQPQHHVGRPRHNVDREEEILDIVHETPSISTRHIANRPVQELLPRDHQYRREYCRWLLHKNIDEPDFLNHVLWTDEAGFTRDGIMNMHNLHVWSDVNPHATRPISFQHRFSVNV
ncbi:uncharacterized protein LOC105283944 [Ooceraea biroi]|uniref:uncharacterized protein LOC105283944 n=1 Tax=Ooceraea biroi TaxID=2015173 RepID=UPI000F073CD1|nr:uncharacterized protein LOC105283944 [Ooceraea biroi]